MDRLSVIIVNWNQKEDTKETLRSISKSKIEGFYLQVIIVDNGSSDGSVASINKFFENTDRKIKFKQLVNKTNLGFCEGNNVGIKYALDAGADYIMLLNNDTIVGSQLLFNLYNFVKNNKTGAVSPKIYFAKGYEFHRRRYNSKDLGRVIWYAGGKIDWDNLYGINNGVDEVDHGQFEQAREIDFASGCCVLLSKEVLKKAGFFDSKYYAYLEDMDLSQRIKLAGYKIYYLPTAFLWHKVAQSSGIGSGLNDYFITRNRLLFGYKYASLRTKFALFRESLKFLATGRKWQKIGVKDYYLNNLGKGSWN